MEINYVHHEKRMPIPYAGRVFTEEEVVAAVSSTLDFWLTLGAEEAIWKGNYQIFRRKKMFIS